MSFWVLVAVIFVVTSTSATGDGPRRVSAAEFQGEWTGVASANDVLLSLRSTGARRAIVAISIVDAPNIETMVCDAVVRDHTDGQVLIVDKTSAVRLEARFQRTWGSGRGTGQLSLTREGHSTAVPLYLFFRPEESWVTRMLRLYHKGWREIGGTH